MAMTNERRSKTKITPPHVIKQLPIMFELCLMLLASYYAHNYASIIYAGLILSISDSTVTDGEVDKDDDPEEPASETGWLDSMVAWRKSVRFDKRKNNRAATSELCAMTWKTAVLSDAHASCLHIPSPFTHPHGPIPSERHGPSAINPI